MKRTWWIIGFWILILSMTGACLNAQTAVPPSPAPTTCPATPCLKASATLTDASATNPVALIGAVCVGSAAACGISPSSPGTGPNTWTSYSTAPLTTTAGSIIIPGMAYGNLANVALQASEGGGTSAWVPQQFQIPPQTPINPPSGVTLTVLKAGQS